MSSAATLQSAPESTTAPAMAGSGSWGRARVTAEFDVSRETLERLDRYVALLETWQKRLNLVGPATLGDIWGRHIADSLQLLALAPGDAKVWLDLGTGAGLPGLVLAIALAGRPGTVMHLVEANGRKCAFLRVAAGACAVAPVIHNTRIEALGRAETCPRADVITARALAPLGQLIALARPFMWKKTVLLLPKGQDVDTELTQSAISSTLTVGRRPSMTDPAATILRLEETAR